MSAHNRAQNAIAVYLTALEDGSDPSVLEALAKHAAIAAAEVVSREIQSGGGALFWQGKRTLLDELARAHAGEGKAWRVMDKQAAEVARRARELRDS